MKNEKEFEELLHKDVTDIILGAFYAVYNRLGYGFLESVYATALTLELRRRGLKVEREVHLDVYDLGHVVGRYRVDMLVEGKVLLEIKSSHLIGESDRKQVYNYLRCTNIQLALLLHFGPKPAFNRIISTNKEFIVQS